MARRLRAGDVDAARADATRTSTLPSAQNHALNAWLTIDASARSPRPTRPTPAWPRRARRARRLAALHPLLGDPDRAQGPRLGRGRPVHGRARGSSRATSPRTTPTSPSGSRDVGAVILGKTNMDEFAMGSSTEHSALRARPPTRGTSTACPGGSQRRLGGGRRRVPRAARRSAPTRAARSASRRRCAAIVGLKPTYGRVSRYGIVAFASSLDQIGPFARDVRDAAALLHAVAGRDERDSTSAPVPGAGRAAAPARRRRRGRRRRSAASGSACRASTSWRAWSPASRRRVREARRGARGGRRDDRGGQPAAHRLRPRDVLHRRPGGGLGEPRPLRRHPLRAAARRGGDVIANYLATRGERLRAEVKRRIMLGTYALSAGYYDAYYLKAQKVRTLIKPDFDAVFASRASTPSSRRRSPTVAFPFGARLADPVAMYLSDACTLPVNMAGLPGAVDPVRAVGGAAGRPPAHRRRPGRSSQLLRLGAGLRGDHRGRDPGGPSSRPSSRRADDPPTPTPAERAARSRRLSGAIAVRSAER